MDNLPVAIAATGTDAVVAVDVGSTSIAISRSLPRRGFAAVYMRSAQVMMHALENEKLRQWERPPMLLVRPPIWHYHWFTFARTAQIIDAGYSATLRSLDRVGDALLHGSGVHSRKTVDLTIDEAACVGCTLCAVLAPQMIRMGVNGKAEVISTPLEWSRADGDFVHQCPTDAIHVTVLEGERRRPSVQIEADDDTGEVRVR
jgi:ferredoxin